MKRVKCRCLKSKMAKDTEEQMASLNKHDPVGEADSQELSRCRQSADCWLAAHGPDVAHTQSWG